MNAVKTDYSNSPREVYIDFLRALGLIFLIGVHLNAPEWYKPLRSFDVPLMVFVSSLCYKPLMGGVVSYLAKRFKRIYLPVFTFLTIYFAGQTVLSFAFQESQLSLPKIFGSYLLLNRPSIGYVWIMRVFLMIALVLPLIDRLIRKLNPIAIIAIIYIGIVSQYYLVEIIGTVGNKIVKYALEETVLYVSGYSIIALLGLKIKEFTSTHLLVFIFLLGCASLVLSIPEGFNPPATKYPPRDLYLIYGLMACALLWWMKPMLEDYIVNRALIYLSKNSMWIYLWHIVMLRLISPVMQTQGTWALRCLTVIIGSVILNELYHKILNHATPKIEALLK